MPKLTPKQMKAAVEEFKKKFTSGFYHGSPNPDITAFDPMKSTVRDVDFVTPGVTFVTKSPKFADSFTTGQGPYISLKTGEAMPTGKYNKGSTMYPVSVDMSNHFDPTTPQGRELIEAYVAMKYADNPKMARQFKSRIEDPHSNWTTMESPAFLQHLRDSGIKTFAVNESGYQNVGVLDPSKIRGKFAKFNPEDAESPDFMKAEGGLVHLAGGRSVDEEKPFIGYPQINRKNLKQAAKPQIDKYSGMLDALIGSAKRENLSVFDPKEMEYAEAYDKYEPAGIALMGAPFLGGPIKSLGKALAPKAGQVAEDILARQGLINYAVPKAVTKHPHGQYPEIAQALEEYLKGNISQEERLRILNQHLPIRKWSELPPNYTDEQIIEALMSSKRPKALAPVPVGERVGNRLDIPAYTGKYGVYVDTTHDAAGRPISYNRTGHLKDVEFSSKPNQAVRVGLGTKEQALTPLGAEIGTAKSPFALIKGTNVGTADDEVRRMMAELLKDPNYTQIGMDPRRHSQFYDKSTGLPVWRAEEKLQSGPLIIAPRKGLEITDWNDPRLELTDFPGKRYAAGGIVNPALQLAKKIAPKFSLEAIQKMPVSSAQKQTPVARAFEMLSSENVDPKVKQQIFKQYLQTHPDLVKKSGATTYDELTQAAYQQMAKETGQQFQALEGSGVKLSFDPTGEKAYKSSKEMLEDALQNKRLTVFQGGESHPGLSKEANEQFRAVHDYFGHGTTGSSFGPKGEELAYGAHSQMYSPLARLAAATETRGQNSLVSYSGINEELINKMNQLKAQREQLIKSGGDPAAINDELVKLGQQWKYAPQKPLILPPEQIDINYRGYAAGGIAKKALEHAKRIPFVHFSQSPSIAQLDPRMYGTGIKGAEASRLADAPDIKPRSYFYVDTPNVRPEAGLGPHKYKGIAEDIYPLAEDPLGLSAIAKQKSLDPYLMSQGIEQVNQAQHLNELERLIKKAGYKGYSNDEVGLLFEPTPVKKAD